MENQVIEGNPLVRESSVTMGQIRAPMGVECYLEQGEMLVIGGKHVTKMGKTPEGISDTISMKIDGAADNQLQLALGFSKGGEIFVRRTQGSLQEVEVMFLDGGKSLQTKRLEPGEEVKGMSNFSVINVGQGERGYSLVPFDSGSNNILKFTMRQRLGQK